jgi:hypothetical protein
VKKLLQALAILAVVGCLGVWPSWRLHQTSGIVAMAAAGVICLIAVMVSLIPMTIHRPGDGGNLWPAYLLGIFLRMILTAALGVGFYVAVRPNFVFYALWMAIFYLVFLGWETFQAIRLVKLNHRKESL